MAVEVSPDSQDRFSISRIISRFRSKGKRNSPPPSAPRDTRPVLKPSPLPLVIPEHQQTLSQLGWTTVTFPQPQAQDTNQTIPPDPAPIAEQHVAPGIHPLQQAYSDLFTASQSFFNLPDPEKQKWKHKLGSEEGWSKIPGEKEFITLRTLSYTPDVLKQPAKRYWDLMAAYLDTCLGRISTSLDVSDAQEEGLRRYVGACRTMGQEEEEKTATMLRLFRYEGWEEKIVAEPHADLGLMSCVAGNVPGLEVWNGRTFWDVERSYKSPCATLLGGRQLERLTNYRYPAGGHRVVSYGKPSNTHTDDNSEPSYRFSIVFVLRADETVLVDTDSLTTSITGAFKDPVKGVFAREWYQSIRSAHFNINTGVEERDEQKRRIEERKKKMEGRDGVRGSG